MRWRLAEPISKVCGNPPILQRWPGCPCLLSAQAQEVGRTGKWPGRMPFCLILAAQWFISLLARKGTNRASRRQVRPCNNTAARQLSVCKMRLARSWKYESAEFRVQDHRSWRRPQQCCILKGWRLDALGSNPAVFHKVHGASLRHAEASPLLASASNFAVARPATDSRQRAILQTDSCALQIPHLLMFPLRATAHSNQARAHLTTDAQRSRVGKVQVQGSERSARSAERLLCSFSLC